MIPRNRAPMALSAVVALMVVGVSLSPARAGVTTRVSVASDGTQGNDNSWHPTISAEGQHVAFHSDASNLVPGDTNGHWDVFVHDRGPTCDCDVAIDESHCILPAAGQVGQCKTGQIGARNLSFTASCDVVMRVIDNAGAVVFESEPVEIGPGRRIRLRFEHCYTADEIGRNVWSWEVWPADCSERTPWDNTYLRKVNVQPGERAGAATWLPLWRLRQR